jgi:hypothetical protein
MSAMITASGAEIGSIFEGRLAYEKVRETLVLRRPKPLMSLRANHLPLDKAARLRLIAQPTALQSCPTGSICGQPGTEPSEFGQFCTDNQDCMIDVHNQMFSTDPNKGTIELFDCIQCCADWSLCFINDGIGPGLTEPVADASACAPLLFLENPTSAASSPWTSPEAGVFFDVTGTGTPVRTAWTDPHSRSAFLTLPGPDGLVHNGKQMFGNFSRQPPSANPNGFLALAEYDKPENGGNGDGTIDERDAVFAGLRLWIDENHDGISQPSELHWLPELGVTSISLKYQPSMRKDQFGNEIRYRARINAAPSSGDADAGEAIYSVIFVSTK